MKTVLHVYMTTIAPTQRRPQQSKNKFILKVTTMQSHWLKYLTPIVNIVGSRRCLTLEVTDTSQLSLTLNFFIQIGHSIQKNLVEHTLESYVFPNLTKIRTLEKYKKKQKCCQIFNIFSALTNAIHPLIATLKETQCRRSTPPPRPWYRRNHQFTFFIEFTEHLQ
jgi:hypothetical protein